MSLLLAIFIGSVIGIYGVYAVVLVYKYKGTSRATLARILGVSSVAIVAAGGHYLLKISLGAAKETELVDSIAFAASIIISMIIFFWINRKKIG